MPCGIIIIITNKYIAIIVFVYSWLASRETASNCFPSYSIFLAHAHATGCFFLVYNDVNNITVRGKILEGGIFGELMALKSLARKNLVNLLVVY